MDDEYWFEIDEERRSRDSLDEAVVALRRGLQEAIDCEEHVGGWRLGVSITLDSGDGGSMPAKDGLLDVAALRREVEHWRGRAKRAETALTKAASIARAHLNPAPTVDADHPATLLVSDGARDVVRLLAKRGEG